MRPLLFSTALALVAASAVAGRQDVCFALQLHGSSTTEVTIVLKRVEADPDRAVAQSPLRSALRRGEELSLPLEAGNWQLAVESGNVWHSTQYFLVAPSSASRVSVNIWPRSVLKATVKHDSKTPPTEMIIRFESPENVDSSTANSGQVRCPIAEGRILCSMPAGTYRLRMRPKGFIAHFFPDLTLMPGQTHDLGSLEFRQGQSITGRVQLPARFDGDRIAIRVTATPVGIRGQQLSALQAQPEKSGFFQIDGVAPGAYQVAAALHRTLVSPSVEVIVRVGSEAELIQALHLNPPHKIHVTILPVASSDGARWHLKLLRSDARHLNEITQSSADRDGVWESPPLQPGTYQIQIGTIAGSQWHREDVTLEADDYPMSVLLTRTEIGGTVRLGDRPLQASLTLSGKSGFKITTQSDERGHFLALLPKSEDAELSVSVRSSTPWIQRTITVKAPKENGAIDIALPDSLIMGDVVDSEGAPVADTVISILGEHVLDDGLPQPTSRKDGTFEAHGLSPGTYSVMATDFLKESEPITVRLADGDPHQPVRLVLKDMKQLRGRVLSSGGPVPGARVQANATNVSQMIMHNRQTDLDGQFAAALPAATRTFEMTIASPGFSFVIAGGTLSEQPLVVRVDQNGGTLVIDANKGDLPHLVHGGGTCFVASISRQWPSSERPLSDGARELVLPMMEPGPYTACLVAAKQQNATREATGQNSGRCISGFLPPFGSLSLDLR